MVDTIGVALAYEGVGYDGSTFCSLVTGFFRTLLMAAAAKRVTIFGT